MRASAFLIAASVFAQDPAALLEKARDKVMAESKNLPRYVCTETIERSYFSRQEPPGDPPSCERILVGRKKGLYTLKLDAMDRLRVSVAIAQGREVYSWTGAAPQEHGVEDILQPGPIGTGAFGAHLLDLFGNPSAAFRLIAETADGLEYGFRVPVEASRFVVGTPTEWVAAGYGGTVFIDKDSLDVRRFTFESEELPPATAMCQESSTLEFPHRKTAGLGWFVPEQSRAHEILRDTIETDRAATLSGCHEFSGPAPQAPVRTGEPLPAQLRVSLEFSAEIDTETAAAGDPISAKVTKQVYTGLSGKQAWLRTGDTVTGRIVRMRRQLHPEALYLISVAFDTLESGGVIAPFYAQLILPQPATEQAVGQTMVLTGQGIENWPHGLFAFKPARPHLVIKPFPTLWETSAPPTRR